MYKLEERLLFDAALPVDISGAVEAAEPSTEAEDLGFEDGQYEYSDGSEGVDQIESESNGDAIEAVEGLTEQLESLTEITSEFESNELYIVDTSVADYEKLVINIPEGAQVELLDVKSDGIQSISDILEGYEDLDALHILSHGSAGKLRVGDDVVSSENLSLYSTEFSSWGDSMSEGSDILLYGCNIAETPEGENLVASVSALTQTDVAASTNPTGVDGNWDLEFTAKNSEESNIEAITINAADSYDYNLATINLTVTTSADTNDAETYQADPANYTNGLSLREAIGIAEGDIANTYNITFSSALDAVDDLDNTNGIEDGVADGMITIVGGGANGEISVATNANITINGDLDNDYIADVTIAEGGADRFFRLDDAASGAVINFNGLIFDGFTNAGLTNTGGTSGGAEGIVFKVQNGIINTSYSQFNDLVKTWEGGVAYVTANGTFNMDWSSVSNLTATGKGGVIYNQGGTTTVSNSYFDVLTSTNAHSVFRNSGTFTIENSTVHLARTNGDIPLAINSGSGTFTADYVTLIGDKTLQHADSSSNPVLNNEYDVASYAGSYTTVRGVNFIDTSAESPAVTTGAWVGLLADNAAPVADADGDVRNSYTYENGGSTAGSYDVMDSGNPLFTDADSDALTLSKTYVSGGSGDPAGITMTDAGVFTVATSTPAGTYVYTVGATDGIENTSTTVTIEVTSPSSAPAQPVDGGTITVTKADDGDSVTGLTDLATDWSTIAANGITLREAVWAAEQLAGGTAETITFESSLSTLTLNSELAVATATAEFTIDADLNDDHIEDITVTRATTGNVRFMNLTAGTVTVDGLIVDDFLTNQEGAGFIVSSSDSRLNLMYSTLSNNTSSWGATALWAVGGSTINVDWTEIVDNVGTGGGRLITAQASTINVNNSYISNYVSNATSMFRCFWGTLNLTNVTINDTDTDSAIIKIETSGTFNADYVTFVNSTELVASDSLASTINVTNELEYASYSGAYTVIDGVRFIKTTSETTGAWAGLVAVDTAPVVDNDGDVRNAYSYQNGGSTAGSYDVMDSGNPLFTDPDGDDLTLSSVYAGTGSAPTGITFTGTTFAVATDVPIGVYEYTVTADDGFKTTDTTVTITVTAPNQAPVVPTQSIVGSDTVAVGDTITGSAGALLVGATDDGDVADLYIATVDGNAVHVTDGYTYTVSLTSGDSVNITVYRDGSYTITGVDVLDASDVGVTGDFVMTVADIEDLQSGDVTVNLTLTGADEPSLEIEVTSSGDADDTTGLDVSDYTDVVAAIDALGANGLTLREAVWVAEQFDGASEVIVFNDLVTNVSLASDLTISSDLGIKGNGADKTTIVMSSSETSINVTQVSDTSINVTFEGLKFTGNTGGAEALIIVRGKGIDANTDDVWEDAVMANVTIESSEFANHENSSYGGAYRAYFGNMTLSNVYIHGMTTRRGAGGYGEMSKLTMTGLTLADSFGTSDWGGFVMYDARSSVSISGKTVDTGFKSGLSYNVNYSTFTNIDLTGTFANTSMLNLLDATSSVTNSVSVGNNAAINVSVLTAGSSATLSTDTREGVAFYVDNVTGEGADQLPGYSVDVADLTITADDMSTADDVENSTNSVNNLLAHDSTNDTIVIGSTTVVDNTVVTLNVTNNADFTDQYEITVTITDASTGAYTISGIDLISGSVTAFGVLDFEVNGESRHLEITVTGANDTPVRTSDTTAFVANTDSTKAIDLSAYFTDADGDTLTYVLDSVSGGADITYSGGNLIVAEGVAGGSYTLTFTANDGTATVTDTISVTVTETRITDSGTPDKATTEDTDETASGDLVIVDSDFSATTAQPTTSDKGYGTLTYGLVGDTLTWTYTLDSSNAAVNGLAAGEVTTDTFTVIAIDSTTHVVTVTITGTNDAPVVDSTPSDETVTIGGDLSFDPSVYFADIDGDSMTYTVVAKDSGNNVVSNIKYDQNKGLISIADSVATGDYTITVTARDIHGATVDTSFTLTAQNAVVPDGSDPFYTDRVVIKVTTGEDDDDTAGATGTTLSELVTELGADGLSLREAVYIANTVDGTEYIMFDSDVSTVSITSALDVTSNMVILGNGADKTTLQYSETWTTINVEGGNLNVTIQGLRFSGSLAGGGTTEVSKQFIDISGVQIDGDNADFASITLESVEFVDHKVGSGDGAVIKGLLSNITVKNAYFNNLHATSGTILTAYSSNVHIEGITAENSSTTESDWKSLISVSSRDSIMNPDFLTALAVTAKHNTFSGNSLNFQRSNIFSVLGERDIDTSQYQTHTFEYNTTTGNYVQNVIYNERGTAVDTGNESDNSISSDDYLDTALTGNLSTRSGVRYYATEDTQNADFADSGADELTDFDGVPVVDSTGGSRDKFVFEDKGVKGEYHIFSSVDPLFTDADLTLEDANNDGLADEAYLFVMHEYTGSGVEPAGITISNDGLVTVQPNTPEGAYTYILTVDDGHGGLAQTTFSVFVVAEGSTNIAPEYTPVEDDSAYLHSIIPGSEGTGVVEVADWFDRHGNDFVLTAKLSNGADLPSWITMNADGSFNVNESAAPIGGTVLQIVQTATEVYEDSSQVALSRSYAFSITINHTPVASVPTNPADTNVIISAADGNNTFIDVSGYFSDSDSNSVLTYVVLDANEEVVDGITIDANGRLIIDETSVAYGDSAVTVTVTDQHGAQAAFDFVINAEGPVVTNLEVGESLGTAQYFDYIHGTEGSNYEMKLITSSGALVDLPDGISIDSDTGEITFVLQLPQQQYSFYVTRSGIIGGDPANTQIESRELKITAIPSSTAIIIDDVYIASNKGTVTDALEKAINDVAEGGTISFNLSQGYINALSRPSLYNADYDGDGDADIFISLKSNIYLDKSVTIIFDTDAKSGDRDVVLMNFGIEIVGRYDAIEVNLSQFAVVGASHAAISQNGGIVTVTDADLADGNIAYYVVNNDRTSEYQNEARLTNINIFGNYTESGGDYPFDMATVYAYKADSFEMNNAFIGGNQFKYSLIRGDGGKTIFNNITIADNQRVEAVRGKLTNSGTYNNLTIVDNVIDHYFDWQGNLSVPDFLNGTFTDSLVAGNTMTYWIDDPATLDEVNDDYYAGVNVTVNGATGNTDNTYDSLDELLPLIEGESADKYLAVNGRRSFVVIDGVIHYALGAGNLTEYSSQYSGSAVVGSELADVFLQIRNEQYRSLDKEVPPVEQIVASVGVESVDYDKITGTSTIDVTQFFTQYDSTSTVEYRVTFYDVESGAYVSTAPTGVSFDSGTGLITYTDAVDPGTLRIAVEAIENDKLAIKIIEIDVKNYAPIAATPVPSWNFTQADLGGQLTFDVDNGYFTEVYESGDYDYAVTGVSFNGGSFMSLTRSGTFQLIGDNLTIVDKYLAAGTYQFTLTATDEHGGTSSPVVITLFVAPGDISPVDGSTITVTTGSDDNDIAAAAGAINMSDGVSRDELQLAWDQLNDSTGVSLREAVWFAELAGPKSNAIAFGVSSVNLGSTLAINSSVSFGNIDIIGKGLAIGSNAAVTLGNIEFTGITDASVITNSGSLNLSITHIHDNVLSGAIINTVGSGSTTITNASIINNAASGLVIDGAAAVKYTTIIDNSSIGLGDEAVFTGVVASPSAIVINPGTGLYNYGVVNGVMVLDDAITGAGADFGLESIPRFTATVTDIDGYDIAPGDILRGGSNVKGGMCYWYVDGSLVQSGTLTDYLVAEADRGSLVAMKYAVGDAYGFMDVKQVQTPAVSTDSTAPDMPVVNYNENTMDATPEFSGTAEANSRVIITINGVQSIAMANALGNWSFESKYMMAGDHSVSILSRDAADNDSVSHAMVMEIAEGARDENSLIGDFSTTPSGQVFVPPAPPVEVYTPVAVQEATDATPEYALQDLGSITYGESNMIFDFLGNEENLDLDALDLDGDGIIDEDELKKFLSDQEGDSLVSSDDDDESETETDEEGHTLEKPQKVSKTFSTAVQKAISKLMESKEK